MVSVSSQPLSDLERMARRRVRGGMATVFGAPADHRSYSRQVKRLGDRFVDRDAGVYWHLGQPTGATVLIVAPEGVRSVPLGRFDFEVLG